MDKKNAIIHIKRNKDVHQELADVQFNCSSFLLTPHRSERCYHIIEHKIKITLKID
jgi:hypothetical protein